MPAPSTCCRATAPVVATPHEPRIPPPAERARSSRDRVGSAAGPARRASAVQETADATRATVLLKGATTLVADPGAGLALAVTAGTAAAHATAGTGDVLGGVIGALIAADRAAGATSSLAELAATAARLHGAAGRIAARVRAGSAGHPIVALDVAEALPAAFALAREPGHDEQGQDGPDRDEQGQDGPDRDDPNRDDPGPDGPGADGSEGDEIEEVPA